MTPEIRVVNKRNYTGDGEYIGRPSPLGNPFRIGEDGTREETIQKYRTWLWEQMQQQTPAYIELLQLAKKAERVPLNLVCSCAPEPCHGDIIKKAIDWIWQQQEKQYMRAISTPDWGEFDNLPPNPEMRIQWVRDNVPEITWTCIDDDIRDDVAIVTSHDLRERRKWKRPTIQRTPQHIRAAREQGKRMHR